MLACCSQRPRWLGSKGRVTPLSSPSWSVRCRRLVIWWGWTLSSSRSIRCVCLRNNTAGTLSSCFFFSMIMFWSVRDNDPHAFSNLFILLNCLTVVFVWTINYFEHKDHIHLSVPLFRITLHFKRQRKAQKTEKHIYFQKLI